MRCPSCGGETPDGKRFCADCGRPLVAVCATCGAELLQGRAFCADCGTPVGGAPAAKATTAAVAVAGEERTSTITELRLVSVLFCDLVGFTPLSEGLDPDEVRELLSGYFDLARAVVARYGGVVQKFIGDAVMAVWGAPVANEDDAERAVRAGLELVSAVATYGSEHAGGGLEARVGIVTGTVATTETPEEGLVVGDRVNTASRVQAAAPPGHCYVDEATRRATEAAIVYADAGAHRLKGKAEPLQLFEAVRIVAGVGGALKTEGLEAPFVGRDRELRLVKDLFLASAEESRAHLVSITGIAGIGKSRLAWEYYKYMDGLSSVFRWHRGRCLSYGEGVAYWALAEMVRGRADIVEGEDPTSAAAKLHAAVVEHVPDPGERQWVEPRLAHLVGLEDRVARDKEDLFAAWRLFFERMSEVHPVVMSFEDMQWADASLLDFVEYLLDWSRNHAIFVLTLARPDLIDRRPSWGAGHRNFTSIYLESLSEKAMRDLITGLVPGLPDDVSTQILDRAEGVPLYAVETVRMLIDRGLLVREGASYRPVGAIATLDVPETLQALIAARLDGLSAAERNALQDAAVIGKSFTPETLRALSGLDAAALDATLESLVRKEVVTLQTDPRSPERGQFSFLQDLVRAVAYDSLPKRQRKEKHLAVAACLKVEWGEEEEDIVEVLASHYLEAYRLAPEADDAGDMRAKAQEMLARAGERAGALAATEEALRYFEQALELAEEPDTSASLEERAGRMAALSGRLASARTHFERAVTILDDIGRTHASARVSARLGELDMFEDRMQEGAVRMERAFSVLSNDDEDADVATLAAQLGRLYYFLGDRESAASRIELALGLAERLDLPEQLSQALNTKAVMLSSYGRRHEAGALMDRSLRIALDAGISDASLRAYNNLMTFIEYGDRYQEALEVGDAALELARRAGDRSWEQKLAGTSLIPMFLVGDWANVVERVAEAGDAFESLIVAVVHAHRGDGEEAVHVMERAVALATSDDVQTRSFFLACQANVLLAEGKAAEALAAGERAMAGAQTIGSAAFVGHKLGFVGAAEAALALGDDAKAEELLDTVERLRPGETTPFLAAQAVRFRAARAAASRGDAAALYGDAVARMRKLGTTFYLALTLLEEAEWHASTGDVSLASPLLAEASGLFDALGARPWQERAGRAVTATGAASA